MKNSKGETVDEADEGQRRSSDLMPRHYFLYPLGSCLPACLKRLLLALYWPLKALLDDWREYIAEVVAHVPSHPFRLFCWRRLCGVKIGRHSSVHRNCRVYCPERVVIGDNTVVNYGVLLDGRRELHIGNNVSISEGTVMLTLGHAPDSPEFVLAGAPVIVEDYVFIGAYARILPGVRIGEGAVVGVGAVVTRDVAPYTVVGGVPARFIRERPQPLTYCLSYRKRLG